MCSCRHRGRISMEAGTSTEGTRMETGTGMDARTRMEAGTGADARTRMEAGTMTEV